MSGWFRWHPRCTARRLMVRHLLLPSFTAVAVSVAACSGTESASGNTATSTATTSSGSSGSGGAGGGAGGCPDGTHVASGGCDATLAWDAAATIDAARHHHVSFVRESAAGPYLYVVGGFDGTKVLKDATRAPIQGDGK